MKGDTDIVVVSVGGSLIIPEGLDFKFLKNFRKVILKYVKKGKKFIIVCGGGRVSREYQKKAVKITKLSKEQLDWLGIYGTWINAELMRIIFGKYTYPEIIVNPNQPIKLNKKILIVGGWKPGSSTDYIAVLLARRFKAKRLVNLTNINYLFDKDPKRFKDARPIRSISWRDFIKIIPKKWSPGLNVPFDPVAAREAQRLHLEVTIMNGRKLENFENFLEGKKITGTVIK